MNPLLPDNLTTSILATMLVIAAARFWPVFFDANRRPRQ
jgi:hypothetical protein